eukprot:1635772-Amphidinium_carterae.1
METHKLVHHNQISEWEKQLAASGALDDAGKVDVQRFVAASSDPTFLSDPDAIVIPDVGLQSLAPASDTDSQTAASRAAVSKTS